MTELGTVAMLRRYPVKSMLGDQISHIRVSRAGVEYDRAFALIDQQTGRVASAKQPKQWRKLLQCSAGWDDAAVVITLPDGRTMSTADPHGNAVLSEMLDRQVTLSQTRPDGASMARLDAEDAIANDLDADVD